MPPSSFLYNTVTLPQERRAIAERAVEHYELEDETPIEGGRIVTHWDTDGPDTVLAVFGAVFEDGIETISLHVAFEPGTTHVLDVHGLLTDNGGDIGSISPTFMEEERVRYEQQVLRETLARQGARTKNQAPVASRPPRRL